MSPSHPDPLELDRPDPSPLSEKQHRGWKPSYPTAILLCLCGHGLFVVVDTAIGFLQNRRHLPTEEVLAIRMAGTLCITISSLVIRRVPHVPLGPPKIRKMLFVRALVCLVSIWSSYESLWYLTTAQFTTMYNLNPLITAFICYVGLGEPFGRKQLIACLISIFAITMVAFPQAFGGHPLVVDDGLPPPSDVRSRMLGLICASFSLTFSALDYFCLRIIGDQADAEQVLTTYAAFGLVLPSISLVAPLSLGSSASRRPVMPTGVDWPVLLLLTLCGTGAQLAETMACATLPGATAAMLGYSGVVWGTVSQVAMYGNRPSWPAVVGMVIIVGAGLGAMGTGWSRTEHGVAEAKERVGDEEERGRGDAVPLLATEASQSISLDHRTHGPPP